MKVLLIVLLHCSVSLAYSQDLSSLIKTSVNVDFLYEQGLNSKSEALDSFRVREAEILFYAPIDSKFNGVLSITAHNEGEESFFEVHEGYFESSNLISGWNLKLGQYFLDLGRLNRIHRHDWSFTTEPSVYRQFFGSEGLLDSGIEASHIFGETSPLELTLGLVQGSTGDHVHGDEGEESEALAPSAYFKIDLFKSQSNGGSKYSLLGYFGNNTELNNYQLIGLNYVHKKRLGKTLKRLIEVELWHRSSELASSFVESSHEKHDEEGEEEHSEFFELTSKKQFGAYINYSHGINERYSIGVLADYFWLKDASSEDFSDARAEVMGITPYFTWNHSEFFKSRISLSAYRPLINGVAQDEDYRAMAQFIFFLGAHPTHDF